MQFLLMRTAMWKCCKISSPPQLARFLLNENTLFQHDGATSHTARMSMNAVNALFPNRAVSRNGDNPWSPDPPT